MYLRLIRLSRIRFNSFTALCGLLVAYHLCPCVELRSSPLQLKYEDWLFELLIYDQQLEPIDIKESVATMAAPRDALGLLMPMLCGDKDDFGKDISARLPLSFDSVNEGRLPTSTSRLFRLPSELIGYVFKHMCAESLPSLAHVSRDCRQTGSLASICECTV